MYAAQTLYMRNVMNGGGRFMDCSHQKESSAGPYICVWAVLWIVSTKKNLCMPKRICGLVDATTGMDDMGIFFLKKKGDNFI